MDQWIVDLAQNEIEMAEKGIITSQKTLEKKELLNHTLHFLSEIRRELVGKIKEFNDLRKHPDYRIKMYSLSGQKEGFMLFRNHYKMVFSPKDLHSIFVTNNSIPVYQSQEKTSDSSYFKHEIFLHQNVLGDVVWFFKKEKVEPHSLAKYYLTQFIQDSFYQ